jgi:hypothetical protein
LVQIFSSASYSQTPSFHIFCQDQITVHYVHKTGRHSDCITQVKEN